MKRLEFALLLALAIAPPLFGQEAASVDKMEMLNAATLKWADAPDALPKGAKIAVLYGDPMKEGSYVIRLKLPAGYEIPPHWHTQDENLTIVSGALYLGSGDKYDINKAHQLVAGGFHHLPGKAQHYAFTKRATIVEIHGVGPFDIHYLEEKKKG